jgi:hypothetical protein
LLETELYLPVKRFLEAQGYAVKAEIGGCDVLAVRGGEPPLIGPSLRSSSGCANASASACSW